MNLIERLGGYKKAKAELKDKQWRKDNLHGSDEFTWHIKQHIQLLEAVLLQYRREHNIFEVGDKVIVITNALGNKFTWEAVSLDGCMVEISQIGQPNEWVHYTEIAHAEPEEIQAGRRLEVCGG